MKFAVNHGTITGALINGDPAVEKFVCVEVLGVLFDTEDPKKFEAECIVENTPNGREQCRVYVTVGSDGKLYGDI